MGRDKRGFVPNRISNSFDVRFVETKGLLSKYCFTMFINIFFFSFKDLSGIGDDASRVKEGRGDSRISPSSNSSIFFAAINLYILCIYLSLYLSRKDKYIEFNFLPLVECQRLF